jgi:hypothetical protein
MPGFGLTLGLTLTYLSLLVLIPLSALVIKTLELDWATFWKAVSSPQVVASYKLSFGASFVAALVNVVFGLLVAWVLVRYRFPGRRIVDALVDLVSHYARSTHPTVGSDRNSIIPDSSANSSLALVGRRRTSTRRYRQRGASNSPTRRSA